MRHLILSVLFVIGSAGVSRAQTFSDASWSALGTGTNGPVLALATNGATVYAGGNFTAAGGNPASNIAKWDGTRWSALGAGLNGAVRALAVSGGVLYAGGDFTASGGNPVRHIAAWDGNTWTEVGTGLDDTVRALVLGGNGDLYAGGDFSDFGAPFGAHLAKWDGTGWSGLGGADDELDGPVHALAIDAQGNLYAGGEFIDFSRPVRNRLAAPLSSLNRIGMWDGTAWSHLGDGMDDIVRTLALGPNGALYAGGDFTAAGRTAGASGIAAWDGLDWAELDQGVDAPVLALAVDSSGRVFAGGLFANAGSVGAEGIAVWTGSAWTAIGSGVSIPPVVSALSAGGGFLHVGGDFDSAGGRAAYFIARIATTVPATRPVKPPTPARLRAAKPRTFPETTVGNSSRPQTIRITNLGGETAKSVRVVLSGNARRDFRVVQPSSTIRGGGTGSFRVTFSPRQAGVRGANAIILSKSAPVTVRLKGTGKAPRKSAGGHLPGG